MSAHRSEPPSAGSERGPFTGFDAAVASGPARSAAGGIWTPRFVRILGAQTTFSIGWSLYLLLPKYVAVELGADASTVGNLSAMTGLCSVATIPLTARHIDRLGRKAFFAAGCAALVALSLGFILVHDLGPLMYVLHGLVGATFVLAFNAGATLATDEVPPERLGQAIGVFGASNLAMHAISTVIGEKLAVASGWNTVFTLGAVAGVVAIFISSGTREPRAHAHGPGSTGSNTSLLALSPLLAASALVGVAYSAMFVFFQPYALSRGAHEVNDFFVGFTATAVASRTLLGHLGDRFGHTRVSKYAVVLYALSAASMIDLNASYLLAYGAFFGLAHGILYPTLNAVVMQHVGLTRRGRAMSLYTGAFSVGAAAGGILWGVVAERTGYPAAYAGATLLAFLALACLQRARRAL